MRFWSLCGVLGLCLGLHAAPAPAQEPGSPAAVDTLMLGDLPRSVAEPIIAFFNRPSTIHFSGRTRIPAGRTVLGDVAVIGGPFVVAGRVEGSVVVIDGDVELLPGAAVAGDLTVVGGALTGLSEATVGGTVATYSERLQFRRDGERIGPRRGFPAEQEPSDGWLARSDFLIASGRSYNRVEGLPITFGPVIETESANPLRLRAMAIYRTESGASLDPEELGYYLRAEQFIGGRRALRVGGTLHSVVEPIEDWHVLNLENSLATFLLRRDFRDHYDREGWSLFTTLSPPGRPWELSLVGRSELHGSLAAGSPWTLFRNQEEWRPQPLVAEGRMGSLALEGRFDTRNSRVDPSHGWLAAGSLERSVHSSLRTPATVPVGPFPVANPLVSPGTAFGGWTSGALDIRRYNRLSPEARLNLRMVVAGAVDGGPLPPQRQRALGGEGSLPGYALFRLDCGARDAQVFRADQIATGSPPARFAPPSFVPAYGCDQVALFQAEYRGKLSLRFGWGGSPWGDGEGRGLDLGWTALPDWVAFVDAAQGWGPARDEEFALDLGFGLLFSRVGVYLATPLAREGGFNLFVRLGPRF